MTYLRAVDVPLQMQWDRDSRLPLPDPGTAPGNCGAAAVEQVAEYYVGDPNTLDYGIYRTRRLANSDLKLSTTVIEQRDMLRRRGVPCQLQRPSVATLHSLVRSGRRPVIIGLDMSRVPLYIAGHPFRGKHAVTLRAERGSAAFDTADPNFSTATNRLDPTRGHRLYPDWVIRDAYWNAGLWAIVPDQAKPVIIVGPTPSPDPKRADGDPYPMRMRTQVPSNGVLPSYRLRAGKPVRSGPLVSSGVWTNVSEETRFFSIGYIDKDDLPIGERVYGDVLMTVWYQTNGDHIGYIKHSDIA